MVDAPDEARLIADLAGDRAGAPVQLVDAAIPKGTPTIAISTWSGAAIGEPHETRWRLPAKRGTTPESRVGNLG